MISRMSRLRQDKLVGKFSCKGYDTFDPLKLIGWVAKGHQNENDLAAVVEFYQNLIENGEQDE